MFSKIILFPLKTDLSNPPNTHFYNKFLPYQGQIAFRLDNDSTLPLNYLHPNHPSKFLGLFSGMLLFCLFYFYRMAGILSHNEVKQKNPEMDIMGCLDINAYKKLNSLKLWHTFSQAYSDVFNSSEEDIKNE